MTRSTMHMKYVQPKEYRPPTSGKELQDRYHDGERYFEDAQLHGAVLDYSEFDNINLSRADLSRAFMRNSTLSRVDFTGANCVNAFFDKSAFYQCCFAKADLRHAYFYGTKVAYVSFFGAEMALAQFRDCLQFARKEEKAGLLVSQPAGATCFVSYSSVDSVAGRVAQSLHRANIPHWFMPYSSWFDAEVSENLSRAIRQCEFFVLVLSDDTLGRRYVDVEVDVALRLRSENGAPQILILKTGASGPPAEGRFAALSNCPLIDCSSEHLAEGVDELVALLREAATASRARLRQ